MKSFFPIAGLSLALLSPAPGLQISLFSEEDMDPTALAAFQMAATYWQSQLTDNVKVNINVGYALLDPNVLASAGSASKVVYVGDLMTLLASDASSANDALAVGNLPPLTDLGTLEFLTQRNTEGGSTVISLDDDPFENDGNEDNDTWANNAYFAINTANAKALGYTFADDFIDASITFSSAFSWDFDNSDGVGAGLQDFVGVAIHEIGHALGFTSGVDLVDYFMGEPLDLDLYAIFNSLDLFRYSAAGELNLGVGASAYFSWDGGVTSLGAFSTGSVENGGDGSQASHWKDDLGLGIMDPTANPSGQVNTPTPLDLIAMDVIGWNLVPEPSSSLLACAGMMLALARRRR